MAGKNDSSTEAQTETAPAESSGPTRTVQVNYAGGNVSAGAGFIHPESKQLITGDKTVSVPDDAWTDSMIRDKTLTEVR